MQFFHEWEQVLKRSFFLIELNIFMSFTQILLQKEFMDFIDIQFFDMQVEITLYVKV